MVSGKIRTITLFGLGTFTLVGASMTITHRALAADTKATSSKAEVQVAQGGPGNFGRGGGRGGRFLAPGQPPLPGGFEGGAGFQGGPGGPGGPDGPGGPGGFGGPPPMGMGGGPATVTATQSAVYVLRGNTLYAFNAQTLKPIAQVELPRPTGGPGGRGGAGANSGRLPRPGANAPEPGDEN